MLSPQERRLLLLLAAWLVGGAALDALSLTRPEIIAPLVGSERFADLLGAGREEPAPGGADPPAPPPPGAAPREGDRATQAEAAAPRRRRPFAYDSLGRLDLNRADSTELDLVDGIGPALASRILAQRLRRGAFRCVEDLLAVRGIGPRTLAKLLPQLTVRAPGDSGAGLGGRPRDPKAPRQTAR
jgi:competence protein ComEA